MSVLTDELIDTMTGSLFDSQLIPAHVEISARVQAASTADLDAGRYTLHISPARAADTLTSRFSALAAPVPPHRIVRRDAEYELADHGCRTRPPGRPPARVIPFTCDQPPAPGEQRRRGHSEHLAPAVPGDQPAQCREPQPVARPVADPADLAAQHRVLMPQH